MLLCSALIPIKYEKSKYELQQKNIFNKRELLYYSKFFSHFSAAAISKSNFHVNKLFMGKKKMRAELCSDAQLQMKAKFSESPSHPFALMLLGISTMCFRR